MPRSSSRSRRHSGRPASPCFAAISLSASRGRTGLHHAGVENEINRDFARRLNRCDAKFQAGCFWVVIPMAGGKRRCWLRPSRVWSSGSC